jgi:hypothetical protein
MQRAVIRILIYEIWVGDILAAIGTFALNHGRTLYSHDRQYLDSDVKCFALLRSHRMIYESALVSREAKYVSID